MINVPHVTSNNEIANFSAPDLQRFPLPSYRALKDHCFQFSLDIKLYTFQCALEHWKLPVTFIGIGNIIGIGRFESPKVLPILT
ncbi:hypothetical protein RIR_jg21746.t1 [Rhizophagus irregularis DAOM 181602=DAOM 197198]|uniref:Uncharacterized protein n=1 Tax=Rhizophagus irregularis (strain DAOM 181602 / DAOM 197198 / MUCL 43194) TaxID=747089 RepID=U9TV24_RHIID|nr:hypothetical protein RIR_jg21746.t1 [Rhizophagus irregularis DAOM 181602=DAOM 197198]